MQLLLQHKNDITYEDLNNYYGEYGMTFKTKKEAMLYSEGRNKKGKKNYITRLIKYRDKDINVINGTGQHREGAIPVCDGYLITMLNNEIRWVILNKRKYAVKRIGLL